MTTSDESNLILANQRLREKNAELEQELRQAKQQLKNMDALYSRSPVGLGLVNTDLCYVGVNQRLAAQNGHSIEEHIGAHISEIIPQIAEAITPIYERVIQTGEPALGFEVPGVSPESPDQVSYFLVSYFPVKDEAGQVTGVSFVVQDTTELKEAENSLQRAYDEMEERVQLRTVELSHSEERWRSLIDTAPDLIMMLKPDGIIQYINRAEQGHAEVEMTGTSAYDYTRADYRAAMKQAVEDVIQTGEFHQLELPATGVDGGIEWYQSRMGPFREEGEIIGVTCIATNITRQKQAEQHIREEQQLLRRLLTLQENERRMVAHDIHDGFVQYAVGANMCVQSISHRVKEDKELKSEMDDIGLYLQKAIDEGRSMIGNLRPMILDASGVVEAITHLIAEELGNRNMTIDFKHNVQFDRIEPKLEGAIFRIVQESLNNAKQHSQVNQASVELTQKEDTLYIVIQDQGVGFDQSKVPPDRFGLRGISERARLFGGTATIKSTPGQGTTVEASLPLSFVQAN
ncbi:MAG: PAS domain-containing sensor histidine kinase [Pirellulales bacterium]